MSPISVSSLLFLVFFSSYPCLSSSSSAMVPAPAPSPSHSHSHSHSDTVEEACRMSWKNTPRYTACVARLHTTPGTRNATLLDLALVSFGLAVGDVRAIAKRVLALQSRGAGGPVDQGDQLTRCLAGCVKTQSNLERCTEAFRTHYYSYAAMCLTYDLDDLECDEVVDEPVKNLMERVLVVNEVSSSIAYKYCRKFAKHDLDCVF